MENSAVSIPEKKADINAQTVSPANVATANSVDMLVIGSLSRQRPRIFGPSLLLTRKNIFGSGARCTQLGFLGCDRWRGRMLATAHRRQLNVARRYRERVKG